MILVVVYVGAVAVLFLFVVMMLDVDFAELKQGLLQYLPIGVPGRPDRAGRAGDGGRRLDGRAAGGAAAPTPRHLTNTAALGQVLYTQYVYLFQAAGFVLLTAMVGAIVLTLQHKPNVKRQNIAEQNARTRAIGDRRQESPVAGGRVEEQAQWSSGSNIT